MPIRKAFGKCGPKLEERCVRKIYEEASKEALSEDHFRIHQWSAKNWKNKPKDYSIRFLEMSHDLIVQILSEKFGFKHETPIHKAPKVQTSEVYGLVSLSEVLEVLNPTVKDLRLRYLGDGKEFPDVHVVGRVANLGMTNHDIDIRYDESSSNPALESAIQQCFPEDLRGRVSFILGKNKSGDVLPQVGVMVPVGSEIQYPTFEEEKLSYRERIKRMREQKELKLFRPFLQMKTSIKAVTNPDGFKKENLKGTWKEAFVDDHMVEVAVEKKFAGAFFAVHKKGDEVRIQTHSGEWREKFIPNVYEDAKKLNVKECILLGELVAYDEKGVPLPYKEVAPAIHAGKPVDDSNWILHVYDMVWVNGRSLIGVEYKERREFLSRLKSLPHIKENKAEFTGNVEEVSSLVKWASGLPGSEGAMLKIAEGPLSKYVLKGRSRGILKYKIFHEIEARVVQRLPKKYETGPKKGQPIPGQFVYVCEVGSKRDGFSVVGRTFATDIRAEPGDILLVSVQMMRRLGAKKFSWVIPRVIDLVEDAKEPDGYNVADRIARATWGVKRTEEVIRKVCYRYGTDDCVLGPYYEELPSEYLELVKIPKNAELQFHIDCEHASELRCPLVKLYYYQPGLGEILITTEGWMFTDEVFWVPKLRVPYRGRFQTPYARHAIILKEPHARMVWEGKKSMVVKKKRLPLDMERLGVFYVGEYAYGIIRLGKPLLEDAEKVRTEFRESHRVSDKEWREWWGKPEKVWTYRFHVNRNFRYAHDYFAPKGAQTIIRNLVVGERTKLRHPTAKYELEPTGEQRERAVPEVPIEEVAERPVSTGTLQRHGIGERFHGDFRVVWYTKDHKGLADFARGFTLTRVPQDLPNIPYESRILAVPKACENQTLETAYPFIVVTEEISKGLNKPENVRFFQYIGSIKLEQYLETHEDQPLDWFKVEGHIPIGQPGSGAKLPGHIEFIEKRFPVVIGGIEPNFVEFFCFGKKMNGRYVFRKVEVQAVRWEKPGEMRKLKGKVWRWIFWRTKDQSRFEELKRLIRDKLKSWKPPKAVGEFQFWLTPFEFEETAEGMIVKGEAIHEGRIGRIYLPRQGVITHKIYTRDELLRSGRTLRGDPIRLSPHAYLKPPGGPIVGQIFWAEPKEVPFDGGTRIAVLYRGLIKDEETERRIRSKEYTKVSVGTFYDEKKSQLVDGFRLGETWFHELVILKKDEFPGDPEAYIEMETLPGIVGKPNVFSEKEIVDLKTTPKKKGEKPIQVTVHVHPRIEMPIPKIEVKIPKQEAPKVEVKPQITVEASKAPDVKIEAPVHIHHPKRVTKTVKRELVEEEGEVVAEKETVEEEYE